MGSPRWMAKMDCCPKLSTAKVTRRPQKCEGMGSPREGFWEDRPAFQTDTPTVGDKKRRMIPKKARTYNMY